MNPGSQNPMECSRFEPLLSEAVEGALPAAEMQTFRLHMASCARCAESFAEALAGRRWLEQLEEVQPPARLLHNILAATSGKEVPLHQPANTATGWQQFKEALRMVATPLLQPRMAGTFAMAFFSVALLLNILGVRLSDVRSVDLHPHAVRAALSRDYYQGRARVLRYYNNMKFVYELQAQLRDLRNALPQQEPSGDRENEQRNQREKRNQRNDNRNRDENRNISHKPQPHQDQQYVQRDPDDVMAANFGSNTFGPAAFEVNTCVAASQAGFSTAVWSEQGPGRSES